MTCMAWRGEDPLAWENPSVTVRHGVMRDARSWREANHIQILMRRVPNIRIFPELEDVGGDFIKPATKYFTECSRLDSIDLVVRWAAITRDWVDNGI